MRESKFERDTIKEIYDRLPGSVVLKNDSLRYQGIPDRLILWGKNWAALEFKAEKNSEKQPNQEYYVEALDRMSFAAFIYPENKDEVLDALQSAFGVSRQTCLFKSK